MAFVGPLGGGIQNEYLGRKISIIINNIVALIGLIYLRFSYNIPLLFVGRIITGYTNRSNRSFLGPHTSEVCQPNIRKTTGTFGELRNEAFEEMPPPVFCDYSILVQ